ncbi:MAG: hypothetical protein WCJ30_27100, partial [Deltaproteobacteria bacterium]
MPFDHFVSRPWVVGQLRSGFQCCVMGEHKSLIPPRSLSLPGPACYLDAMSQRFDRRHFLAGAA